MGIGTSTFPIQDYDRTNYFLKGMQQGNDIAGGFLQNYGRGLNNQAQGIRNQYLPDSLQAALMGQQLSNQSQGIKNQYLPDSLQASLQNQLLVNQSQGIQNQYLPQNESQKTELGRLQNIITGAQAKYAEQEEAAKLTKNQYMAQHPLLGAKLPPGAAGQVLGMELTRQMYGEDSPQYQMAKKSFDLGQQNTQSQIDFRGSQAGALHDRYNSPQGRAVVEAWRIQNGLMPNGERWDDSRNTGISPPANASSMLATPVPVKNQGGQPITDEFLKNNMPALPMPGQKGALTNNQQSDMSNQAKKISDALTSSQPQPASAVNSSASNVSESNSTSLPPIPDKQKLLDQYSLAQFHRNIPTFVLQKNLAANNIEKTIDTINPDDITSYSGSKGQAKFAMHQLSDSMGLEHPEYTKYKTALDSAHFLADQVRTFYGSSVQPSEVQNILHRFDTGEWASNPATAKAVFNNSIKILRKEMQTYRDAMMTPKAYTGESSTKSTPDPLGIR